METREKHKNTSADTWWCARLDHNSSVARISSRIEQKHASRRQAGIPTLAGRGSAEYEERRREAQRYVREHNVKGAKYEECYYDSVIGIRLLLMLLMEVLKNTRTKTLVLPHTHR